MRVGLAQVRDLGVATLEALLGERDRRGPFSSLNDFLGRVDASFQEVENLILCGGFDAMGRTRPELILELHATFDAEKRGKKGSKIFSGDFTRSPRLRDFSQTEKLKYEWELLGLTVTGHPMDLFNERLKDVGTVPSSVLRSLLGERVRVAGILVASRGAETNNGKDMGFLTLEDKQGVFEVTLFPGMYERYASRLDSYGPYLVEGKVEAPYDALSVVAERVRNCSADR